MQQSAVPKQPNGSILVPFSSFYSFFFFFNLFIYLFIYLFVVNFVIHWNETAMGLHVFPIPIPP